MVPNQRTFIVLGALIVGMSLASSVLLLLEPGPMAPFAGVTLQSIDRGPTSSNDRLFDTASPQHDWQAIVIHDSGQPEGNAHTLDRLHDQQGRGGLGYHFVLNNGRGADDGLIELGFRWQHQFAGAYVEGEDASWFNRNGIGICLVGDADNQRMTRAQLRELVWLVRQLQQAHNIPRDAIHIDVGQAAGDEAFPFAWFRQQLLDIPTP
ncbi:peptidoglycan recognition family protein [Phycisphaerales bacterium AB-hyl4]|uniref:Peptidoglycan recognition family protein n=1 Tax=Natronomicrosphaera hydrolytica TaxID=3242702 RepID=A0ABV4U5U8_9BACT